MCAKFKTFKNWDNIDSEEYLFQQDNERKIDNPELGEENASDKKREEFDDSDDFHKYDDTDENTSEPKDSVRLNRNLKL